jgi:hypothetical protein
MADRENNIKHKKKFGLRRLVPPAFIVMLFISLSMWYLTKLDGQYTTDIPVTVDMDGNEFKVTCMATASGRQLLLQKVFRRSRINLDFGDIETSPSELNPNRYVISKTSLQNAIQLVNNDIHIVSVGDIPEITRKGTDR